MVKNLKSLLAGTVLLSLTGCVTYTTTTYPSPPRPPIIITRTEHVYFSIQNVPSHQRHIKNFSNPTRNDGWDRPEDREYKERTGRRY